MKSNTKIYFSLYFLLLFFHLQVDARSLAKRMENPKQQGYRPIERNHGVDADVTKSLCDKELDDALKALSVDELKKLSGYLDEAKSVLQADQESKPGRSISTGKSLYGGNKHLPLKDEKAFKPTPTIDGNSFNDPYDFDYYEDDFSTNRDNRQTLSKYTRFPHLAADHGEYYEQSGYSGANSKPQQKQQQKLFECNKPLTKNELNQEELDDGKKVVHLFPESSMHCNYIKQLESSFPHETHHDSNSLRRKDHVRIKRF